jgi:hypothetical protein
MKAVALTQRNHFLGERPHFLCLRQRCHDATMIKKIRHQIPQQRTAM